MAEHWHMLMHRKSCLFAILTVSAMTDQFWRMQSPVAFSSILLDQEMYKNLIADRAKQGLRIEGVPLQVS